MALPSSMDLPGTVERALLEAGCDGIWEDELPGRLSCLSDGWYASFGYTLADYPRPMPLNGWFGLCHPEDLPALAAAHAELAAGRSVAFRLGLRLRAADGAWRHLQVCGQVAARSADGVPVRLAGTLTDVTEQKELLASLATSQRRNEMFLRAVPDLLFVTDGEGRILDCSVPRPEWLAVSAEQFLGRNVREILPGSLAERMVAVIRQALGTQRMQTIEYRLTVHGAELDFEARLTPHGEGLVCCIVRDVTERRMMDRRLAEARNEYERLVRSLPVGVFSFRVGKNGTIRSAFVSPRMAEILRQPLRVLRRGRDGFASYLHPADLTRAHAAIDRLLAGETVVGDEFRCLGPAGDIFWVRFELQSAVLSGGERCLYGTASDITARKLAEEEYQQLQLRLQRTERMRGLGQLAGGVAHEFNNQLASVFFFVDSIKKGTLTPRQLQRYADLLRDGAQRISDLTQKLLDFSRQGSPRREVFDLHKVLGEFLDMLDQTLGCRIRVNRQLAAPSSLVVGDPCQISSAMLNLALNARDAMTDGGTLGFATACIELDAAACRALSHESGFGPGSYIRLSVSDTGEGMDAITRERIFEPFFTTKPLGKGTGLGLAVVYGTVIDHAGAIAVDSEPGKGSTFHIFLPLCANPLARAAIPVASAEPVPGSGQLLLVDDETLLRILLRDQLEQIGYQVADCADGREALERFSLEPGLVDGVILDVSMPGMSGLETHRALRQIRPTLPILLISGSGNHPDVPILLQEGAFGLVTKPVDLALLSQKLAALLGHAAATL
ncbi:MAG: PAS domain-containing protein [Lentisphaeria bacterium]|nr:PAS domain-containing protein [Lentisphaeria bacterium]